MRGDRTGVVFDGWTSPLNPGKTDITETAKDQAVVDQIIKLIPEQVKTFSVVGATTVRKLAPDPDNPRVDYCSYSIDPDVILNIIKEILAK